MKFRKCKIKYYGSEVENIFKNIPVVIYKILSIQNLNADLLVID